MFTINKIIEQAALAEEVEWKLQHHCSVLQELFNYEQGLLPPALSQMQMSPVPPVAETGTYICHLEWLGSRTIKFTTNSNLLTCPSNLQQLFLVYPLVLVVAVGNIDAATLSTCSWATGVPEGPKDFETAVTSM